jgi:hypothetical protein
MDLFDPVPFPRGPKRPRYGDRRQEVAGGAVAFGLPIVALAILTVTDLSKQPMVAMVWMPAAFTAVGLCVCILTRMRPWRTFTTSLACLWWCLMAGLALVVIDILIFPF